MLCPKCRAEVPEGSEECLRCGVIFARMANAGLPAPRFVPQEIERIADGRIGGTEVRVLSIGLALALITYAMPWTRFVFSMLVTLFHELGHAIAGWLMGYPSLPAFDFVYGGGLTHHGAFRLSIAVAIGVGFAWAAWLLRGNRNALVLVFIVGGLWLLCVTKEWRREIVFAAAGHVGELVLAGIMFYRAVAGVGWRVPLLERPAAAFVAFFVLIHSALFAWRLNHDAVFLSWYREGKGGALMNDLEVVALNLQIWLGLNPGIEGVARWLLVATCLPIAAGVVWHFQRVRVHRVLRSLTTVES
ncbi:MAG TPA: hypothetical protein VF701_17340 [Thermoanaerobaculia bacterium]